LLGKRHDMSSLLDNLITDADNFSKESGLAITTISNKLFGHGQRIDDYRKGTHSPSLKTLERAYERLAELKKKPEAEAA